MADGKILPEYSDAAVLGRTNAMAQGAQMARLSEAAKSTAVMDVTKFETFYKEANVTGPSQLTFAPIPTGMKASRWVLARWHKGHGADGFPRSWPAGYVFESSDQNNAMVVRRDGGLVLCVGVSLDPSHIAPVDVSTPKVHRKVRE